MHLSPFAASDDAKAWAYMTLAMAMGLLVGCGDDVGVSADGSITDGGRMDVSPGDGGADGDIDIDGHMTDGGRVDGATPIDGGGMDGGAEDDWPLPRPGEPGTGPACAAPPHGPIDPSWPEVFVGVDGCSDEGTGQRATPFCTFARAFEVANAAPFVVTVLDGVYRQRSHRVSRPGTADSYFVIRADVDAHPVILGSESIAGSAFEAMGGGLYRADIRHLENDPTGFWTADGRRFAHSTESRDGRRHAPVDLLTEPGWTKATAEGAGCDEDNAGCFIYLRPPDGVDVAATNFEASQGSFFYSGGGHYQVVDGLSVRFTQSTAIFFEGARHVLIQNSDFAHNANGNDNAYSLRLWGADGAIVRNNRVSDSEYWGGAINSHGITFMVGGDEEDIWVCENEIFDMNGAGVSTKNGASHVHVVGNYLHDLTIGVRAASYRCDWRGCDTHLFEGGHWTIRENLFERCGEGVMSLHISDRFEAVGPNRIYNNLLVDVARGVVSTRANVQPFLRNNVFTGSGQGVRFQAGGETTWPDYYIGQGFDSDHHLFDVESAFYVQANWSGTEEGIDLESYQSRYDAEPNSDEGVVTFGPRYRPVAGSLLDGRGDPAPYDTDRANRGLWPLLSP